MKDSQAADRDDCPTCSGYGFTSVDVVDRRGEHDTREVDCDDCGGEGRVEREPDDAATEDLDYARNAEVAWEASC